MGICAGIDLLGKFFVGNDDKGGVGKRFRNFLITYFSVPQNDAETLYQLRNSLLHSFGLYSEVTDKAGKVVQIYKFVLYGNTRTLITPIDHLPQRFTCVTPSMFIKKSLFLHTENFIGNDNHYRNVKY